MDYRIVGDSCCDLTKIELGKEQFISVPLTLQVDDVYITDDDTFDQGQFIKLVANSKGCPKSACPAPETYMDAYATADDIYVVTLSAELSGSYNSAVLAKNLYLEENGAKNIHIFNSRGASSTQLLICRMIDKLAGAKVAFSDVVTQVEAYIESQNTYFVLETLDFLRKNGRLTKVQAILAGALNIKPVMGANSNGEIVKLEQVRGIKKALMKMVDQVVKDSNGWETLDLVIAHCNCRERAIMVKEELLKKAPFRSIDIIDTRGVSTLYAGDGGVIICC